MGECVWLLRAGKLVTMYKIKHLTSTFLSHRWELSTLEISLLSLFLSSLPPASCRDIPVYLPRASNKVAHRLLVITLLEGIEVSLLCGPEPALTVVQGLVKDYWSGIVETLRGCAHVFPRCVPLGLNFEPSVLAFCLVNLDSCRCLTSLKPSTAPESLQSTLTAGTQGYWWSCRVDSGPTECVRVTRVS